MSKEKARLPRSRPKTSYRMDYSGKAQFTYNRTVGVIDGVVTDYEEILRRLARLSGGFGDRLLHLSTFIRSKSRYRRRKGLRPGRKNRAR
jgi:hypothetical protein